MRQSLALPLLLLWFAASGAMADPLRQDADWLKTIAFAAHQTDYSGIFIYQAGANGRVEASRITHISDDKGEHEKLESLNGARREIIRHNDQVWLYLGERKARVEKRQCERSFPALLPEQISILQENYTIRQAEEDRVAGFHAHALVLQPKDNLRYTHKMWAHNETGLLLKAVVTDERGQVIEQYAFTQLTIGDKIERKWLAENPAKVELQRHPLVPLPKAGTVIASSNWQIDALPAGFKKILEMQRTLRNKKNPVTHLVYSDGLAGVSVFIEALTGETQPNIGLTSQGAVQVYNRILGDKLITVVGEVPPRAVMQIAESVRYAGQ